MYEQAQTWAGGRYEPTEPDSAAMAGRVSGRPAAPKLLAGLHPRLPLRPAAFCAMGKPAGQPGHPGRPDLERLGKLSDAPDVATVAEKQEHCPGHVDRFAQPPHRGAPQLLSLFEARLQAAEQSQCRAGVRPPIEDPAQVCVFCRGNGVVTGGHSEKHARWAEGLGRGGAALRRWNKAL